MIRLGDGEGNLLAKFGHESNLFVSDYYNRILQIMFGDSFSLFEQFGVEVKSKFLASLEGADVIGYCANFEKNLKNSKSLASDRVLAGQLSTVDYVRSKHFSQSFGLSTAVATHNPESISSLFSMLESENFLGLVTCHSILKEKIRKTFNIRSVVIHETPGESKTISDAKLRASHFPTVYKKIIDEISVPFVGAVYLVGAGLLGKVYCGEIKRQGGIAIDIGSVMDALAGIKTRGNERLNDVEFHQRWNIEKFTKGIKK